MRMRIAAVGFFPPPVDGQRLITLRMCEQLEAVAEVARHDLGSVPGLELQSKWLPLLAALLRMPLWRLRGCKVLYLAPHSGTGLVGSLALAVAARLLRLRLYVHYHSYKNFDQRSLLMATFVRLCGTRAVHIALPGSMAASLRRNYPGAYQVAVLSNSAFLPERERVIRNASSLRIGHLSNLCRVKGLDDVLACMRALRTRGVDATLVLAGPAADPAARQTLQNALAEFDGKIQYLGPLGQNGLQDFYANVDVFLFPSRYQHEAEPLVLLEALSFGVPVIATDRGAIPSMIGPGAGHVFNSSRFVADAATVLESWAADRGALRGASESALAGFVEMRRQARSELGRLLASIDERRSVSEERGSGFVGAHRTTDADRIR